MDERCDKCRFYQYPEKMASACRKHAPSWNGKTPTSADFVGEGKFHEWTGGSSIWPQVDRDDWCGDFEPRNIDKPPE